MIRWYEQGLDWMIQHTTIEMGFCLFLIAVSGMICFALWIMYIASQSAPLKSDIDIFEAIQSARNRPAAETRNHQTAGEPMTP